MPGYFRLFMGALLLAPATLAAEPYSYADFEASVPHIDLQTCPDGLAEGLSDAFCRVTMNNDALHIYVFEAGGIQEFVAVHSFYEDEFTLRFGD